METALKNIIGLTRTAPITSTVEQTADAETSTSGLFLDELAKLEWLKDLNTPYDFSPTGVLTKMAEAKREAIKETKNSLLAALRTSARLKYKPFVGTIGANGFKGYLPGLEGQVVTLGLKTNAIESAFLKITAIAILSDVPALVQLSLPDAGSTVIPVAAAATPTFYQLEQPLLLPLNGGVHSFSYTVAGFSPANNALSCGCSSMDKLIPSYISAADNSTKGLVFVAEMKCKEDSVILLNYSASQVIADVLAYAIRYKTAELLTEKLLSSGEISRNTMIDVQSRYGDRNHFRAQFENRIMWLASPEGIDLTLDSCYHCAAPGTGFRTTTIYS